MRHRKTIGGIALLAALSVALCGCGPLVQPQEDTAKIYATFYPIYALADAVIAGVPNIELHCLIQPQDGCLRAYSLSDWDLRLLASANGIISGGRGLESFESTLFSWGEDGPVVSAVLYNLELYKAPKDSANAEKESHLKGENPHLYMSIDGAAQIVESISAMMVSMDPKYAAQYAANTDAALEKLSSTAAEARSMLAPYSGRPVILMNEALIYAARDYGLEAVEWIDRESATGLYDEELRKCIEKLDQSGAKVVLIERQAPDQLLRALEDAGYIAALMDVFSTGREGEGFDRYLKAQIENARSIRDAFARAEEREAGR